MESNAFQITEKGIELFCDLAKYIKNNGYEYTYRLDDVCIGKTIITNNFFDIHINKYIPEIQKEMVLIHELLHAKQIISEMPIKAYKFDSGYEAFESLYESVQSFILDAPIHKQLREYGYDITSITKKDRDALLKFYAKPNIKPMSIEQKNFPVYAAELYFSYSAEAYKAIMDTILEKNKEQYDIIVEINSLLKMFVNCDITFIDCFQSIIDILTK